jgi:PAS domain S-box-containing protein
MELSALVLQAGIPLVLLVATLALARAYDRLRVSHHHAERERDNYLGLLEASNDALFVIDFVNGRILQANERASALLGHPRERLAQLTIFDLHRPEDLQRSAVRFADAWERQGTIHDDIPLVAADGTVVPVECSTRVSSYRGKAAIILLARDIRERLALQRELAIQQERLRQQHHELLDGIRYAQRIQRAVLREPGELAALVPDSFILLRPRDLVSGDFHWFAERDGRVIVAAADCTGHGVPGALLSVIGAGLFDQQVHDNGEVDPGRILDGVRNGMVAALNRNDEADRREGMNAAVIAIDPDGRRLHYAGAYGPLLLVRDGSILEWKGDRMPLGPHEGAVAPFTTTAIELCPGDRIFLYSDGLQDQFGGPQGKKLRSSGLKQWLLETSALDMDGQHQALSDRFRLWKGGHEQVDDVLLIGLRIAGS